jgi:hypothetical protein
MLTLTLMKAKETSHFIFGSVEHFCAILVAVNEFQHRLEMLVELTSIGLISAATAVFIIHAVDVTIKYRQNRKLS